MITLFILNDVCSGLNYGIGTYMKELLSSIKNNNIEINVLNFNSEYPFFRITVDSYIKYWDFPKPLIDNRTISPQKQEELYYHNVIYLIRLYSKKQKDIIFHLNFIYEKGFIKELKMFFECKVIICLHYLKWCLDLNGNMKDFRKCVSSLNNEIDKSLRKKTLLSIMKEKETFAMADKIICLSIFSKNILHGYYHVESEKLSNISNGLADLEHKTGKKLLRLKYNVPNVPVMIFVGRVEYRKGLLFALRAFRKVLKNKPNCLFVIVGKGDFNLFLNECRDIWMNVIWTGMLDNSKLHDLYSLSDFGILLSFAEQCSYVAIEMMMHGLPIIASTSTGLNEMVIERYNGFHIPVQENPDDVYLDIELIAEKLLYLVNNPLECKQMGINSRLRYEKNYTSEIMGNKMIELYKSLIS